MSFDEKLKPVVQEKGSSSISSDAVDIDNDPNHLHDPRAEDTLHRGLKARQISMIAVSSQYRCPQSSSPQRPFTSLAVQSALVLLSARGPHYAVVDHSVYSWATPMSGLFAISLWYLSGRWRHTSPIRRALLVMRLGSPTQRLVSPSVGITWPNTYVISPS